jgi:integrase
MAHADVPSFWGQLAELPNTLGRDALKLAILTATRSNEVRFAVWAEFDLDGALWSIPAVRMKTREAHAVPLSEPAVALMRRLRAERLALNGEIDDQSLVFTYTGKSAISDMTILKVLRDMQLADVTVHGFRSTFTDWTAECTEFPKEVADKALAHRVPNAVEAAYRRTDFFDKRRRLMRAWGEFVAREDAMMRQRRPSGIAQRANPNGANVGL